MVDLVGTLVSCPTFDGAEVQRLLRETEAEIVEATDNDRFLVSRAFRRTLFAGHPYGRRTSGSMASLRRISVDDVRRFYERHYCQRNATVAVSGDITADEAQSIAHRLLASLPPGEAIPDVVPAPLCPTGRHLVFVEKPERTQTEVVIGTLGTHAHDPDHTALLVANTAFGGTFTSRLMQEIRVKRGWSYGASSRVAFDRQRDAFTMWTAPAATDASACVALELELLHTFREEGPTEAELEFVQRFITRSHAFDIDTARKRVHQKIEADLYDLPAGYHDSYLERVASVDLRAAHASVRHRISEDDLVIAVVGTHAEIGKDLERAIPKLSGVTVVPFNLEATGTPEDDAAIR